LSQGNYCRFINESKDIVLAERAFMARSFFSRFKGLLGTANLEQGEGLYLEPCSSIHMFGMKYAIDALFIDKTGLVVGLVHSIKPGALSKAYGKARGCLELPAGTLAAGGTALGDRIVFVKVEEPGR
jgi:uncharacterized protein